MKRLAPLTDISNQPRVLWPTEAQQLLLQAALLESPHAAKAWAKWLELQTGVIDIASWRLIPLVYVNLKRLGVDDALLVQAKELHLFQWRSNQKLYHQTAGFLDELRGLEIPALVLKGVALAHLYYPDSAARPMDDLDVLVPEDKFFALCAHLLRNGWTSDDFASYHTNLVPSVDFKRADGFNVDIHCHVLHANCTDGADNDFWANAQKWSFKEKAVLTLAPKTICCTLSAMACTGAVSRPFDGWPMPGGFWRGLATASIGNDYCSRREPTKSISTYFTA